MLAEPQYVGRPYILTSIFRFGNAGVDFFFVLSGFIIFYVHANDIGRPGRISHYLWQRFTRIYPIYWVVTFFVIAMAIVKQDWAAVAFQRIVESVFLIPGGPEPILGVAWTLTYEVAFYAVFSVAIISARTGIICAAGLLALAVAGSASHSPIVTFLQSPFHAEFALGMFAALVVQRASFRSGLAVAGLGLAVFVLGAWMVDAGAMSNTGTAGRVIFSIASFFLIIGAAKAELGGRLRIPATGTYLGAASYAIYLIHVVIIGLGAKAVFFVALGRQMPVAAALLICLLAVAAGCALHSGIEKPMLNTIRGRARPAAITAPGRHDR